MALLTAGPSALRGAVEDDVGALFVRPICAKQTLGIRSYSNIDDLLARRGSKG